MKTTLNNKADAVNGISPRVYDVKLLIQIAVVLTAMVSVKAIADYFEVTGAGSIAMWCGILMATWFMKRENIPWVDYGLYLPRGRKAWFVHTGLALATVVAVFLMMGLVLDPLLTNLGLEKPADAADRFRFFLGKPTMFITYLVTIVWFGAALGEELLIRGYLLNRLIDFFGSHKICWIASLLVHSVIFGSLHSYQGFHGVVSTGFISIVFGTVYLLSGRKLFVLILAHALINTISLTAFYLTGGVVN